jgi:hypothetical protein
MPRSSRLAVLAVPLLLILSLASTARGATAPPSFSHVFVIFGENKELSAINSTNAPWIMGTLKPSSAWLTGYDAVVHKSRRDYVAITSGQYSCLYQCTTDNVFDQAASWTDWNESMPQNCYSSDAGSDKKLNSYKAGHNAATAYGDLACGTYDVPAGTTGPDDMSSFNAALASGNLPQYNFISPNLCEDGHDQCHGANEVTEYNNFLEREVPLIQSSPAWGSNSVIFVTYDEGTTNQGGGGNVMMAVVGGQVNVGTYSGSYNHYSTLRTIEDGLGDSCLNNACSASDLPVFS